MSLFISHYHFPVPADEIWRINAVLELIMERREYIAVADFSNEDITIMIDYLFVT